MDDNCGEWVEFMGQEVSVSSGCGCKEVYRFPHTTYPYYSCICSFLQQHPFVHFLKCFLYIYILYNTVCIVLYNYIYIYIYIYIHYNTVCIVLYNYIYICNTVCIVLYNYY